MLYLKYIPSISQAMWLKLCHLHHPPIITILYKWYINHSHYTLSHSIMAGLWHCVTYIIPCSLLQFPHSKVAVLNVLLLWHVPLLKGRLLADIWAVAAKPLLVDDYRGLYPIGSMYAIYGNIYHQYTPNVGIYTIHGSYGYYPIDWRLW